MRPLDPMTVRRHFAKLLILVPWVLAACGTTEPADELADALERWSAQGLSTYSYVYQRTSCECLEEWTRPFRVEVVDEVVVSIEEALTGAAPPEGFEAPTVLGLFELIEDALQRNAYQLDVTYHPTLGYPTEIVVDYSAQIADDEFVIRAESVAAPSS